MNIVRFTSALVLVLAATACSDDEDSTPTTGTASNQPSAGNGGSAGSAGGANASTAGNAGAPATANGGSSAEGPDDDIDLQPGDGDDDNGNAGNGAPTADAGAPDADAPAVGDAAAAGVDPSMSFFVTSRGGPDGGNLGGLEGADALCTTLASAVSSALGAKTWRAYLSTSTVNARDRIGAGPWRNARGAVIGNNVDQIHDQTPGAVMGPTGAASEQTYPLNDSSVPLDETGAEVPSNPVLHDILTGSNLDGTVSDSGTCSDWTSTTGTTRNGHSNRAGGGDNPSSWNSAHDTSCGPVTPGQNFEAGTVSQGGGRGSIYCFAAD